MIIRSMTLEDCEQVRPMMQKLHKLHVAGRPDLFVDVENIYSPENYAERVESDHFLSLVAEEDGRVLGFCFVQFRDRSMMVNMRSAYLDDLYVDESCRGKGIATALLAQAEAGAKARGAQRLDLMVWCFNEQAMRFYEKHGLTPQRIIYEKKL